MPRIPQATIDEILTRTDIAELIQSYVPLTKKGLNFQACCPFHQEKTPSFTVSPGKQFFHCFGCQANGNAIGFLIDYEKLTFLEAIQKLADRCGVSLSTEHSTNTRTQGLFDVYTDAQNFYQQALRHHPQAQQAVDYLKSREISGQIAKIYGIGFAPPGWNNLLKELSPKHQRELLQQTGLFNQKEERDYDRLRNRITFPIRNTMGKVIGFGGRVLSSEDSPKYLNSPETAIFHKGQELYGLYEAKQAKTPLKQLLITEGYLDVIALAQHGFPHAVATLGTAVTDKHITKLLKYSNNLIFCFDGDSAGKNAAWKALNHCLPVYNDAVDIRFLWLGDGQDPDSLLRDQGAEAFQQLLNEAQPLVEALLTHLRADNELKHMEDKARFASNAMSYVAQMPKSALQHMMINRVNQITGMDIAQLYAMLPKDQTAKIRSGRSTKKTPKTHSNMRQAIALLLQNPKLALTISAWDKELFATQPGGELLNQLFELITTQQATVTTGALIEHWREQPHFEHMQALACWQHEIPNSVLDDEFQDIIEHLKRQDLKSHIDQLIKTASQRALTEGEAQQLQQLIQKKQSPTEAFS